MKIAVFLILSAATASMRGADFKTGLEAYTRGDFATAIKEWEPLAERGDPHAQYNLGLLFARGQGVTQDYAKAADWYRKAATQGVAAAQYNLGVMYANGQGVQADANQAAEWFLKAAEQDVPIAQVGLGRIYYEGEGAARNYSEAGKWYRKAADSGIASAAFDLGVMYDRGQGVKQDYEEALKWYRQAADAGYAPAMTNLGILYYNAQGVKRDLQQSYAWFARAQKLGDPRARQLMDTAARRMRPKDVAKAEAEAAEWQPKGAPPQTQTANARLFKPPVAAETATTSATTIARAPAESPANAKAVVESAATSATTVAKAPGGSTAPKVESATTAATTMARAPAATPSSARPALESAVPSGNPAGTPKLGGTRPQDTWPAVERIVAVGDIHGDYEQFAKVLQSAGLIDANANWSGGNAHLVQTGDVVDRGPDSKAIMDLLIKLEKQAAASGGGVHCLLGNHEAMNLYGDLRYVSPGEFAALQGNPSGGASRDAYPDHRDVTAPASPEVDRARWESSRTPGFAEHRAAFGPEGPYGRWLRTHNAAIKIGRTLFVHAGLGPKYASWSLDRINDSVREELNDFTRLHGGIVTDVEGPLWYQGLASGDEASLTPVVQALLRNFDVDRIVIGHSYSDAAVTPRFGGRVLMIDVGLSRVYDNVGKIACLEIDREHAYALHRGQGIELPKDADGPDMMRYLQQAAALDPQPSPLAARIEKLRRK